MQAAYVKVLHNPVKEQLVLSYGKGLHVINSSTGEIVNHVEPIESSNKGPSFERFRSLSFNNDGSLLATTGEDKELRIWNTESWSEISKRSVPKRVNALHFTRDGKTIVEADKFGDVYCFPTELPADDVPANGDEQQKHKPIVGHVSMVTDMVLSDDERYVITADRDEHIRISRYPNGYNIESYCLGHTDVVTNVRIVPWSTNLLVSAGGDCTVRLWDFVTGKELQSLNYKAQIEKYVPEGTDANSAEPITMHLELGAKDQIAVMSFAKTPILLVLTWNASTLTFESPKVVETAAPVLNMTLDNDGNIWTVLDNDTRVALYVRKDDSFEAVASDDSRIEKINATSTYELSSKPDYYTIFGLRKYVESAADLDLDREERRSHVSPKKKRKQEKLDS
ncbi:hypothetical protein INT43_006162 [Umbelopsis isabellina]|uniref:Transfer RNA methyltransferase 82 n=1 Tax=Mortierella isabellina TaxID=91625 RepID=A0A8H7PZJ8_MORIS|nr:hypothetical protein INT43_006162 [Umbelopsis isabellina]